MNPFLFVAFASFFMGLVRLPWWTIAIWPSVSIALGLVGTLNEPPNYDMPGFALIVGIFIAAVCVAAWLAGRGVSAIGRRLGRPPEQSPRE
jgi:hypothetical protein